MIDTQRQSAFEYKLCLRDLYSPADTAWLREQLAGDGGGWDVAAVNNDKACTSYLLRRPVQTAAVEPGIDLSRFRERA